MERGFASIGLWHPANAINVGGVLRAAQIFGVKLVVMNNGDESINRLIRTRVDTTKAWRHIPTLSCDDVLACKPYGSTVIAVEKVDTGIRLPHFTHPERAYYIFGPESGSISDEVLADVNDVVSIPMKTGCMNLAQCVNVVLYDRMAKKCRLEQCVQDVVIQTY